MCERVLACGFGQLGSDSPLDCHSLPGTASQPLSQFSAELKTDSSPASGGAFTHSILSVCGREGMRSGNFSYSLLSIIYVGEPIYTVVGRKLFRFMQKMQGRFPGSVEEPATLPLAGRVSLRSCFPLCKTRTGATTCRWLTTVFAERPLPRRRGAAFF